jgi:hypothetical protein
VNAASRSAIHSPHTLLVAIRLASDAARVHIIERRYLEPPKTTGRYSSIKTCCGVELTTPFDEWQQEDIYCETCVAKVEKQQTYLRLSWQLLKSLSEFSDVLSAFESVYSAHRIKG